MADYLILDLKDGPVKIRLRPDLAPNHVGHFMAQAARGAYNGTVFHRVVRHGIIQGGDPLTTDPAKVKQYGTGGLGVLRAEPTPSEKHTRGAVSAVLQPGKPDSAGSQFFICVADSHFLDWNYTVFGEVVSGMEVADRVVNAKRDGRDNPLERVEMMVTVTE